jgi:hypothetical protein
MQHAPEVGAGGQERQGLVHGEVGAPVGGRFVIEVLFETRSNVDVQISDRQNSGPRVDVMITIFCNFRQFSAKKFAAFLKEQCYDQNFA